MKIAYVISGLTAITTFVIGELEAHERAGWQVLVLASRRWHRPASLCEDTTGWVGRAIFRPSAFAQAAATLREVVTHPVRFLKVCFWLMNLLVHSPIEFAKAVYELTVVCYFAGRCRCEGVEHIHVHFASRSLSLGLMIGMLTGLPVSCTVHAFDIFTRSAAGLRIRLSRCKFIAAISRFNVEYLRRVCGEAVADLCRVVHCGVDPGKFCSIRRQVEPGKIVCVCRLDAKKGLEVAIRACAELRDNGVGFLFEIVGDGQQRRHLEELIVRLHLEDRVKLLGSRPNEQLVEFYRRASVFFMPCVRMPDGDMDGIPVAMMEAMACEVPVVSTAISGIGELVEDGVTGRLAMEKDVEGLAEILKEVLGDRKKLEWMGRMSRERILKEFNIWENAAKLRGLIES